MNKIEILNKVKEIIKPYCKDIEAWSNLNENTDFLRDLKINSANLVDIVLDIEDQFNIEIDNAAMEKMFTVAKAIEIVQEKINSNQ